MSTGSMTKAELVEEVSRVSDLTKKHSEVIVETVFQSIIDALHRGEKIELRGFGSFRLRQREPRKGRNPKTGDKVDVPPKKVPYFKPGKELKDLLNRDADGMAAPATAAAPEPPPPDAGVLARRVAGAARGTTLDSLEAGLRDRWHASATGACSAARRRERRPARRPPRRQRVRHPQPLSLQQRPRDGGAAAAHRVARRRDAPTSWPS